MVKKHVRKFIHVEITPPLHDDLINALDKQSKAVSRNISITEWVIESAKKHVEKWGKSP